MFDVTVTSDEATGVVSVFFETPGRANAVVPELADRIAEAVDAHADTANCIVLRSGGSVFCAGVDLEFVLGLGSADQFENTRKHVYGSFQRLVRSVVSCPVPVIARLQGGAMGVGADLALACDVRVASSKAWLQESWILLGATSALGGAHRLERMVGSGRAMELLLTARRIEAAELASLNLVEAVVAPDQLDDAVTQLANTVADRDRSAVLAVKALVRGGTEYAAWEAALKTGLEHQLALICRPEFHERVEAMQRSLQRRN